jgi:hypothetical protein
MELPNADSIGHQQVKLSENPKIEMPLTKKTAPLTRQKVDQTWMSPVPVAHAVEILFAKPSQILFPTLARVRFKLLNSAHSCV